MERVEKRRGKETAQQAETKEERKGPPCRPQYVVSVTEQVQGSLLYCCYLYNGILIGKS